MDYEKAYNEAIKRAKAIIEVAEKEEEVYKSAITIFPELRESEDEQIRKEIEQLIQCMHDADPRKERWIAWLEKQKEYESTDFEYVWDRTDCGDLTSALDKYSEEAIINMCHAWYDKGIELERKSWLEKQGEQKTSVVDFKAKDGDVLAFKNNVGGIIICKSPTNYDTRSYCRLIRDNLINKEESGWDSTLLVPATKEQSDTLLKAMADAGYTFDFGKKELKKIEKKSQRMVSAEVKEALYDKPTDEEMKELLRTEYEKGRADAIAEMEKDWSEEDEDTLAAIIAIIRKQYNGTNIEEKKYYNVLINWLKSLKDRYTWRPSNEQIDTLEHFVRSIGERGYASPYDNNTKLLYSLLEQLKKLKA